MSVEKHRTLLFADNLEQSRQTLGRCVILPVDTVVGKAGDGIILPGHLAEKEEPVTGWRMVPSPGRGQQPRIWDGKPGHAAAVDALVFPDLEKTHLMATWEGQNFGAHATEWEALHSPLLATSPRMKAAPVVDACGMVIGYLVKKMSTSFLFATENDEIFCTAHWPPSSSVYGGNTRKLVGNAIYVTDAQKVLDAGGIDSDTVYVERIKKDKWADVLVDIDGFVLAIDSYGDPPPDPSLGEILLGFLLPTPPGMECLVNEFGERLEPEEVPAHCALDQALFILDMVLLIAPFSKISKVGSIGRKLLTSAQGVGRRLRAVAQGTLRAARGAKNAVRLTIDLPKLEIKALGAATPNKPRLILSGEKSGKKANFMKVDLGKKTGMTHMAIRDVRYKLKKLGVRVRFRPAGTARKLRKKGAVPKWEDLKMKTISDDDILLGAPKSGKGKPGYFDPSLPDPKLKQTDPARYEKVMKRYNQRKEEFREMAEKVKKLEEEGEIVVKDKVVYHGPTGKDIAGDYDIYEILDKTGKRITPDDPRYNKILDDLRGRRIGAQHGAHVDWNPKDPFEIKIKDEIIQRHKKTEPLFEFREDGSVWETFAD